ncbi:MULTISPECIES: hypothetical protein [unclassified Mesorhizobium]|uniref:hypothetical protein n=1 Tax=unclassified Mesorhizobium TaxID=325217 RepID=UPI002416B3E1|nr:MULTISPECIES: hypothetical protein [unclassified Mesorhizobium]WFP61462.1 hypothetical protein QAZ47_23690 [Mesorhizobium sp. WSM4904]WFP74765.1 hypothetical protein QAZ22_23950 [Mesorhizobium sp. WSM4906]
MRATAELKPLHRRRPPGRLGLRPAQLAFAALSAISVLTAACSVVETYGVSVAPGEPSPDFRCKSEAGSYSLSATTWSFEINTYDNSPFVLEAIQEKHYPDARHTYCLDYLASGLAKDQLTVGYSSADTSKGLGGGLLEYVASYAVDKSQVVIRNLIRAIFIGISGRADFTFARESIPTTNKKTQGRFEVDPLDEQEMATLNKRLADFGFCLVLSGYSFEEGRTGTSAEAYCSDPLGTIRRHPSKALEQAHRQAWLVEQPERTGILYRPRLPYALEIYTQDDPHHSAWQLRKVTQVEIENISPIVSLGINRALFAEAKVGLEFDAGVLKNFCLSKSSEVAGFVDIPLDIVYGITELPAQTIKAEVERANSTVALTQAQMNLLDTQRQYELFLREKNTSSSLGSPGVIQNSNGCNNNNCTVTAPTMTTNEGVKQAGPFLEATGLCQQLTTKLSAIRPGQP